MIDIKTNEIRKKIAVPLLAILSIVVMIFLSGCTGGNKNTSSYKVNLEIWVSFDNSEVYTRIIEEYRKINPKISGISIRKFTVDTFKNEILEALAAGNGPDIILINNTWAPYFMNKIEPAPGYILGEQEARANFMDIVADDFILNGKIYGVPLSVDSLALYYNRDLFNAAGIVQPPTTWEEFQDYSRKMTKLDDFGNITQAGAALGTAFNVNRSPDILGLMMMQNGAQMVSDDKTAITFNNPVNLKGTFNNPAEKALGFYTQFANSGSPYYSWNSRMHYSIDAFSEGNVAMMLNYSWHIDTIKKKNSKINFGIANIPQFKEGIPLNFGHYYSFVVMKNRGYQESNLGEPVDNKVRIHEAWQFLKFLTVKNGGQLSLINAISGEESTFSTKFDPAASYLEKTGRPAARRDLIEKQKGDLWLGPFAYGNLIAKNWYQPQPEATESILADAIDSVNLGKMTIREVLTIAASRISQLMRN